MRSASFIYRNKNNEQVEVIFYAKDEDDLDFKGRAFEQIYMGAMNGSIVAWTDDPILDFYR